MDVRTYGRAVDDDMAIKLKFPASMGYHIFLTMALRARSSAIRETTSGQVYHYSRTRNGDAENYLISRFLVTTKMTSRFPVILARKINDLIVNNVTSKEVTMIAFVFQ